jgi:DDE domain
MVYLWLAVDADGEVLDVLVQSRRNKRAALKLMRKLLKKYGFVPDKLVTDDLRSYAAAASDLGIARRHERGRWRKAENSHQPTRRRECKMQGWSLSVCFIEGFYPKCLQLSCRSCSGAWKKHNSKSKCLEMPPCRERRRTVLGVRKVRMGWLRRAIGVHGGRDWWGLVFVPVAVLVDPVTRAAAFAFRQFAVSALDADFTVGRLAALWCSSALHFPRGGRGAPRAPRNQYPAPIPPDLSTGVRSSAVMR